MSIMQKIFGQFNGPQAPAAAPNSIQTQPTQTATAGNGMVPANATTTAPAATGAESSLDAFKDLWQTDPNAATNEGTQNFFNVDPAKLSAAVSKADFTKGVSRDVLAKVAAGGEEAIAALQQALNGVAASSFSQQTMSTTKILEQALAAQREQIMKQIPDLIKQQTVSESLKASNPLFSNPAVAPMLEAIQSQMQVKFPNATSSEIKQKAEQYMQSFADMMGAPSKAAAATAAKAQENEWDSFLL